MNRSGFRFRYNVGVIIEPAVDQAAVSAVLGTGHEDLEAADDVDSEDSLGSFTGISESLQEW